MQEITYSDIVLRMCETNNVRTYMTLFEKRLRFDHESNNQISISQTDFVVNAFIILSVE